MARYGLVVKPHKGKQTIKYVTCSSPSAARKKFYGSKYHLRTEAVIKKVVKIPTGYKLQFY